MRVYPGSLGDNNQTHKRRFIDCNPRNTIARKERSSRQYCNRFDGPGVRYERIKGYDSRFCVLSFYRIDRANINTCNGDPFMEDQSSNESLDDTMRWAYYFTSTFESVIDITFSKRPLKPMLLLTVTCISTLAFVSGCHIVRNKVKQIKQKRRKR